MWHEVVSWVSHWLRLTEGVNLVYFQPWTHVGALVLKFFLLFQKSKCRHLSFCLSHLDLSCDHDDAERGTFVRVSREDLEANSSWDAFSRVNQYQDNFQIVQLWVFKSWTFDFSDNKIWCYKELEGSLPWFFRRRNLSL